MPTGVYRRKSHCIRGHLKTEDNLYIDYRGYHYCKICKNEKTLRWRESIYGRTKTKNARKIWREKNKLKVQEQRRTFYLRHREKIKRESRIYRLNNLEKAKDSQRQWYIKNRDREIIKNGLPERRYQIYRGSAERRSFSFTITFMDFLRLVSSNCYYCEDKYERMGVDRLDNENGYTPGNCVSCCRVCNIMKNDMTYDQFIDKVTKVVRKHAI